MVCLSACSQQLANIELPLIILKPKAVISFVVVTFIGSDPSRKTHPLSTAFFPLIVLDQEIVQVMQGRLCLLLYPLRLGQLLCWKTLFVSLTHMMHSRPPALHSSSQQQTPASLYSSFHLPVSVHDSLE